MYAHMYTPFPHPCPVWDIMILLVHWIHFPCSLSTGPCKLNMWCYQGRNISPTLQSEIDTWIPRVIKQLYTHPKCMYRKLHIYMHSCAPTYTRTNVHTHTHTLTYGQSLWCGLNIERRCSGTVTCKGTHTPCLLVPQGPVLPGKLCSIHGSVTGIHEAEWSKYTTA